MECREVRELAESYLSEELLVETNHQVLRHLDQCPMCRADLAGRQELRSAVRRAFESAGEIQPSDDSRRRVEDRLRSAAGRRSWRSVRRPLAHRGAWWTAAATTLAATIVAVFFLSGRDLLALARDAAGDHRDCAVRFKLAEKPISLDDAAGRYGAAFARLRDAPPEQLIAAAGPVRVVDRHACVFRGRRFAHIVLTYQGHKVSLLVSDDQQSPVGGRRAPGAQRLGWLPPIAGFNVAWFENATHVVFVVSDLDRETLQPAAEALAASIDSSLT